MALSTITRLLSLFSCCIQAYFGWLQNDSPECFQYFRALATVSEWH